MNLQRLSNVDLTTASEHLLKLVGNGQLQPDLSALGCALYIQLLERVDIAEVTELLTIANNLLDDMKAQDRKGFRALESYIKAELTI